MSELIEINHAPVTTLASGELALVFKPEGFEIVHNIESLKGGVLDGANSDTAPALLALAMIEIVQSDTPALEAALARVSNKLGSGTLRLVQ